MCGIVGVAGSVGVEEERIFKSLLLFDTLRGVDATGIIQVTSTLKTSIYKRAIPAWELLNSKRFDKMMSCINKVLIGHNRSATRGHVSDENAHPFEHGTIIGVHNGTLTNVNVLEDHLKFDVDSEALIFNMAFHGVAETYKKIKGGTALVWWDKGDETLNFLRNSERPFTYAYSTDMKTLFWSSELGILKLAVDRSERSIKDNKYYSTKADHHYIIKMPQNIQTVIEKPKVRKLEASPVSIHTGYDYHASDQFYKQYNNNPYEKASSRQRRKVKAENAALTRKASSDNTFVKGDTIYFNINTIDEHGIVRAISIDKSTCVRIFTNVDPSVKDMLKNNLQDTYSGEVSYVTIGKHNPQEVILKLKTIQKVITNKDNKGGEVDKKKPQEKSSDFPIIVKNNIGIDSKNLIAYCANYITETAWWVQASEGCSVCGEVPAIDNAKDIEWIDIGLYICSQTCVILERRGFI